MQLQILKKTLIEENFKREFEIDGKEFENTINISINVGKDEKGFLLKDGACILKMIISLNSSTGKGEAEYSFSFHISYILDDNNINIEDFNAELFNSISEEIYDKIENKFREGGITEYEIPRMKISFNKQ